MHKSLVAQLGIPQCTDYERPNEAFFHRNPKLLGLGRQFGQINFGAFGVFSANYQHPFWYSYLSPLSMLSIIQPLFLQKTKPFYPNSKYLFGIDLNLGRKEFWDLVIVCP